MKHRPWQYRWWLILLLVGGLTGTARAASDVDILLNKLVEKRLLTASEAQEVRNEMTSNATPREANPQAFVKETAQSSLPGSSRRWQWGGDIRFRNEYRNRTGTGQDINRQRIRFRYGFDAQVADTLHVGARFATGSVTDPTSTNQSLNTSFNHKTIVLDRAYGQWQPVVPGLDEVTITGGVIANPFWNVGGLVWDDDLNFDGGAVHLAQSFGPLTFFATGGAFDLQTDVSSAAALWSAQGGVSYYPFTDAGEDVLRHLKVTGALAYHDYMNLTRTQGKNTALATAGGTKGNSANLKDVNLVNPTVEIASTYADVPFAFFGDWVSNTGASVKDHGFQLGIKVGKATAPFDAQKGWEAGYFFERLDPDATFGAFTDSDFGNGGTNHRGHVYWLKFAVLQHTTIGVKYFNTRQVYGAKNKADTVQMDWVTSF